MLQVRRMQLLACCRRSHILAIVGGVLAALLLIGVIIVAVVYFKRQWARSEENKARINARLAGEDEILVSHILPAQLLVTVVEIDFLT